MVFPTCATCNRTFTCKRPSHPVQYKLGPPRSTCHYVNTPFYLEQQSNQADSARTYLSTTIKHYLHYTFINQALAHTLQGMGQDEGVYQQYIPLALHLADEFFLTHSSRDVQLLIACCIADVLRVYAPEAPYKDQEQVRT